MKHQIRTFLNKLNIEPSRRAPYLSRRYPFRNRRRMLAGLGSELGSPTSWAAVEVQTEGKLGEIFEHCDGLLKWVHYLPVYESLIERSRPIRLLEIGVFNGGSLNMWRKYLHANSTIVGIDIDPECRRYDNPSAKVHVRIGGQQDERFLKQISDEFGPFDVIIDDGSHMTSHMVITFKHLFMEALLESGLYIVEDVHTNYWKTYRDSEMSFTDFVAVLIDAMHAQYQGVVGEPHFRTNHPDRLSRVTVPRITPRLGSIQIYDSIVAIRKASRKLPTSVYVSSRCE